MRPGCTLARRLAGRALDGSAVGDRSPAAKSGVAVGVEQCVRCFRLRCGRPEPFFGWQDRAVKKRYRSAQSPRNDAPHGLG
jgi:hypothetical protein